MSTSKKTVRAVFFFKIQYFFLCGLVIFATVGGQEEDPFENQAPWPAAPGYDNDPTTKTPPNPWHLVADIQSQISCGGIVQQSSTGSGTVGGMTVGLSCDATSTKTKSGVSVTTEAMCRKWCESTVDSQGSPWTHLGDTANNLPGGIGCEWKDAAPQTCNLCTGAHVSLKPNTGWNSFLCTEANDFLYESDMWQSTPTQFDWTTTTARVDENDFGPPAGTKFRASYSLSPNRMYQSYATQYMSHIRIEMCDGSQCKLQEYAVTPQRAGKFTLKQLVTTPGGSAASTYDIDNKKDSTLRGTTSSPFGFQQDLDANGVYCWHIGFNHHVLAGTARRNGVQRRTGRGPGNPDSSFAPSPRVRIGTVKGTTSPCNVYKSSEGIGMDSRYNRPGKRLQAGLLQYGETSLSFFRSTKIWVANTLGESYTWLPHMYRPFGGARDLDDPVRNPSAQPTHGFDATFQLLSKQVSNVPGKDGVDWKEGRMTFSFFLKLRRDRVNAHYNRVHRDIARY